MEGEHWTSVTARRVLGDGNKGEGDADAQWNDLGLVGSECERGM